MRSRAGEKQTHGLQQAGVAAFLSTVEHGPLSVVDGSRSGSSGVLRFR